MTSIRLLCDVPPGKLDQFIRMAEEVTGKPLSIDEHMTALCDLDEEKASMTVFQAKELPDVIAGINGYLEASRESHRLPANAQGLSPEQKQTILNFAATLAWKRYFPYDGLSPGWRQELPGINLVEAPAPEGQGTNPDNGQRHNAGISWYQTSIHELDAKINPAGVEASMRAQYGTLDHLSAQDFKQEIGIAKELERQQPGYLRLSAESHGMLEAFEHWETVLKSST